MVNLKNVFIKEIEEICEQIKQATGSHPHKLVKNNYNKYQN